MAGKKGRSGRRPIPTAVKKARGTLRKHRTRTDEMKLPRISRLTPPEFLDSYGLEEWNRIVPMLDNVRVLTDADLLALGNYCSTVSVCIRATLETNKSLMAPVIKGSKMRRVHPMIRVAKEARAECLRYAQEFGLTPSSRSRISAPGPEKATSKGGDDEEAKEDVPLFGPPRLVVEA